MNRAELMMKRRENEARKRLLKDTEVAMIISRLDALEREIERVKQNSEIDGELVEHRLDQFIIKQKK